MECHLFHKISIYKISIYLPLYLTYLFEMLILISRSPQVVLTPPNHDTVTSYHHAIATETTQTPGIMHAIAATLKANHIEGNIVKSILTSFLFFTIPNFSTYKLSLVSIKRKIIITKWCSQ